MLQHAEKQFKTSYYLPYIIVLLTGLGFLSSCSTEVTKEYALVDYIPKDAQVVIKINDFEKTKSKLRDNSFIKKNKDIGLFSYFSKLPILKESSIQPGSLLCFSPVGKNDFEYTFISKFKPDVLNTTADKKIESIPYADRFIHKVTMNSDTFFATQQDSILISSSSQLLIENIIRQHESELVIDTTLRKAYEISGNDNPFSLLINGNRLPTIHKAMLPNDQPKGIANFSNWASLDINVEQNSIQLHGIAMRKDSLSSRIAIFDNTIAQENRIAQVVPTTAQGFVAYTYDDYDILKKNLAVAQERQITDIPKDLDDILRGITELGLIFMEDATAFSITAIDPRHIENMLGGNVVRTYREIPIYDYENPITFSGVLKPLIPAIETNYYIAYGSFIIFAEQEKTLQDIIANILNKTLLSETLFYKKTTEKLSDHSSILLGGSTKKIKNYIAKHAKEPYQKDWAAISIGGYELGILQFIKEKDYAHIHGIFEKNISKGAAKSVTQTAATTLENSLLSSPVLVKNHRTKGLDVAVQDINNHLYLISDKGTIFWKKQINGAIMGDIKQIDIYKNGRYQLLFNTKNTLYLVDRDGKDVAPYPIKFKDPITQPLSLFDYDKNKRYRILITQKNKVKMYDAKAKIVKGFKFSGTKTEITLHPKHIRMNSKDYLLFTEKSGKLTILNRLGQTRVRINETINFSKNEWYQYQNKFTSTTADGNLIQFNAKGNISSKNLGLAASNNIVTTNKTFVSLSENILTIKGKKVELDFGSYTEPKLFYINNKIYITITDQQAKKVYLYDSNAESFPNFPVYGNSAISLGNMDKDSNLEFAVQGEANGVLIYQIN